MMPSARTALTGIALALGTALGAGALIAGGLLFHPGEVRDRTEDMELFAYPVQSELGRVSAIAFAPEGQMFVAQRDGTIDVFASADTDLDPASSTVPDVRSVGSSGLLSLVVDPAFDENRYVYACASRDDDGKGPDPWVNQLIRLVVDDGWQIQFDRVLADFSRARPSRNGCALGIDDQGKLWVALGDTRRPTRALAANRLEGRVLAIDVDTLNKPRAHQNRHALRRSFVASGLRDPVAVAFTPNGDIWLADAGPDGSDEVNQFEEGADFGWPCSWGEAPNPQAPKRCAARGGTTAPAWVSPHDEQFGIRGVAGIVGERWNGWQGDLIVAGRQAREVHRLHPEAGRLVNAGTLFSTLHWRAGTAAVGPDGDIYLAVGDDGQTVIMRIGPV